jgi:phage terminase Nu1 subunit (DNA packaging protein)
MTKKGMGGVKPRALAKRPARVKVKTLTPELKSGNLIGGRPKLAFQFTPPKRHSKCDSLREAARRCGMSSKTLQGWKDAGLISQDADGKWDTAIIKDVAENRLLEIEMLRDEGESRSPAIERLRSARASQEELRLAQMRGELISAADVQEGLVARIQAVRRVMQEIPKRLATRLVGIADPWDIEEKLREEMERVCNAFASGQENETRKEK